MVEEIAEAQEEIRRLEYDFFLGDDTDINLALREGIKRIRSVVDDVDAEFRHEYLATLAKHRIEFDDGNFMVKHTAISQNCPGFVVMHS